MAENQVKDVNWWHEQLIEWLMRNPDKRLYEAAEYFNKTSAWLSVVMRSDVFKDKFQACLNAHRTLASRNIIDRLEGVAELTLDELERRLEEERTELSFGQLKETAIDVAKLMGYGAKSPGAINVSVNNTAVVHTQAVNGDVLRKAQAQIRTTQQNQLEHKPVQELGVIKIDEREPAVLSATP